MVVTVLLVSSFFSLNHVFKSKPTFPFADIYQFNSNTQFEFKNTNTLFNISTFVLFSVLVCFFFWFEVHTRNLIEYGFVFTGTLQTTNCFARTFFHIQPFPCLLFRSGYKDTNFFFIHR